MSDNLPTTIVFASPSLIILSDHTILVPKADGKEKDRQDYPELFIENNLPQIQKAAFNTFTQLLTLSNTMQLISLDTIVAEALDTFNKPHEPTHDSLPQGPLP